MSHVVVACLMILEHGAQPARLVKDRQQVVMQAFVCCGYTVSSLYV